VQSHSKARDHGDSALNLIGVIQNLVQCHRDTWCPTAALNAATTPASATIEIEANPLTGYSTIFRYLAPILLRSQHGRGSNWYAA
jgi:hypothetical protein